MPHLNNHFSTFSKKIHMPHCSHTTHNPVTTASHLNLFLSFFFRIQSKNRRSSRQQDFRSRSLRKRTKGIPETRRALVKVRTHPAHAPGLLLVLSKLDTPSNQQQIQPRRCLSDTTTHHNTLGPCVPQKSHFGGVMASNRGSLRGEGGGRRGGASSQLAGAGGRAAVRDEHALLPLHVCLVE